MSGLNDARGARNSAFEMMHQPLRLERIKLLRPNDPHDGERAVAKVARSIDEAMILGSVRRRNGHLKPNSTKRCWEERERVDCLKGLGVWHTIVRRRIQCIHGLAKVGAWPTRNFDVKAGRGPNCTAPEYAATAEHPVGQGLERDAGLLIIVRLHVLVILCEPGIVQFQPQRLLHVHGCVAVQGRVGEAVGARLPAGDDLDELVRGQSILVDLTKRRQRN